MVLRRDDLQTTTTTTTLSTSRIGRRRRHVLDSANLDAATGERAQRALTARTRRLRLVTTLRAHLDVQRGDAEFLASRSDILRRKHRRVRGGFIAISLHLHTAGATAQGFLARQIRDVLRGKNGDTRVDVSLSRLRGDVIDDESLAHIHHTSRARSRRVARARIAPASPPSRPLRALPRDRISRSRIGRAVARALRRTHHERVVERRKNVRDAEDELAFARVGADVRSLRSGTNEDDPRGQSGCATVRRVSTRARVETAVETATRRRDANTRESRGSRARSRRASRAYHGVSCVAERRLARGFRASRPRPATVCPNERTPFAWFIDVRVPYSDISKYH